MSGYIQIFLAHANEDKPQVEKIYQRLKRKGYKPWMDKQDLLAGQNWRVEIPNAIRQSQIFIACFSQVSVNKQGYIQKELKLALNQYAQMPPGRIFFISLKLDDCKIPALQLPELGMNLQDYHWLDYQEPNAFNRLVKSIESEGSKTTSSPTNTPTQSTPSNSSPVTSQFNNRLFASIGVVILLLLGVPTGMWLLNPQRKTTSPTPTPEAPPQESLNADYSQLENLLEQGNWKEADKETTKLILKVAQRENEAWLDIESIKNFSCPDLKKIDGLWVKYSNERFGFSVQKNIRQKEGLDLSELKDYERYLEIAGWRKDDSNIKYSEGQFSLDAPVAHLPSWVAVWPQEGGGWGEGKFNINSLVQRTVTCNL